MEAFKQLVWRGLQSAVFLKRFSPIEWHFEPEIHVCARVLVSWAGMYASSPYDNYTGK
jgi:hypothetical protein